MKLTIFLFQNKAGLESTPANKQQRVPSSNSAFQKNASKSQNRAEPASKSSIPSIFAAKPVQTRPVPQKAIPTFNSKVQNLIQKPQTPIPLSQNNLQKSLNFQPRKPQNLNLGGSVAERLMSILKNFGPEERNRVKPAVDAKISDRDFKEMMHKQLRKNQNYIDRSRYDYRKIPHSQEIPNFNTRSPRRNQTLESQHRQQFSRSKLKDRMSDF